MQYNLPENWKLIETGFACPEQYDLFNENDNKIAYLRLRHGYFSVRVPDSNGSVIYEGFPVGDGMFYDQEERNFFLTAAIEAIKENES